MKQWIVMLLALLLLTVPGCGSRTLEEPMEYSKTTQTPPAEQEKEPEEAEEPEEPEPVEIPLEIVPPEEIAPQVNWDVTYEILTQEGAVEDAVGYVYAYPVFADMAGAETINTYYEELMDFLVQYARETVYPQTMERHTVASIEGSFEIVAADEDLQLGVQYTVSVQFADAQEPESFDRTDVFQPETGTLLGTN